MDTRNSRSDAQRTNANIAQSKQLNSFVCTFTCFSTNITPHILYLLHTILDFVLIVTESAEQQLHDVDGRCLPDFFGLVGDSSAKRKYCIWPGMMTGNSTNERRIARRAKEAIEYKQSKRCIFF